MRSWFGAYLRSDPNGSVHQAAVRGQWEVWQLINEGTDHFALRSVHGTYLNSHFGGVKCSYNCGEHERWRIEIVN